MAIVMIGMTYYVMALVPTIALTELGVRSAVAVLFLGQVTDRHPDIVNATVSLWLINLAVPALIGIVFVFMFKLDLANGG
jgi:hypothetical protein